MTPCGSRVAIAACCVVLTACVGRASCGAPAKSGRAASNEIVLGEPEPAEPTPPGLRPCPKDDSGSCGVPHDEAAPIVPGAHYHVPVLAADPTRGPSGAPVTIVVFSDFQCPFCAGLEPTLQEVQERYPTSVRVVWKDHPLVMHAWAMPAALLAREAYDKGGNDSFWPVHDRIFAEQEDLSPTGLEQLAHELGLSWPPRGSAAIDQSIEQARVLGVRSTPTSFVNGRAVVGDQPVEAFTAVIDDELAMRGATAARP